ncbi:MAG: hypothetical protein ACMUHB_03545 [Thermoplasmatota archaeon]
MRDGLRLVLFGMVSVVAFGALAGCYSIEEGGNEVTTFNAAVDIDAENDIVTLEIISGEYEWEEYEVLVDQIKFTTSAETSRAGDEPEFTDPSGNTDFEFGATYKVKVVEIAENRVVMSTDVIAK